MNISEFEVMFEVMHDNERKVLKSKGADYTQHSNDRLANFKRTAKQIGITPFQVWAVFAHKHWDAIMSYVKTGEVESEPFDGRVLDLRNYLALGLALYTEQEDNNASNDS